MATKTTTGMMIERPDAKRLAQLGVTRWPIWTKAPSTFAWSYDEPETCYFLEGDVTVQTPGGDIPIRPGDLVMFPKGLRCTWQVHRAVRKHYRFC